MRGGPQPEQPIRHPEGPALHGWPRRPASNVLGGSLRGAENPGRLTHKAYIVQGPEGAIRHGDGLRTLAGKQISSQGPVGKGVALSMRYGVLDVGKHRPDSFTQTSSWRTGPATEAAAPKRTARCRTRARKAPRGTPVQPTAHRGCPLTLAASLPEVAAACRSRVKSSSVSTELEDSRTAVVCCRGSRAVVDGLYEGSAFDERASAFRTLGTPEKNRAQDP